MSDERLLSMRDMYPGDAVLNTAEMRQAIEDEGFTITVASPDWQPQPSDDEIKDAMARLIGMPAGILIINDVFDWKTYLPWGSSELAVSFSVRFRDMRILELGGYEFPVLKLKPSVINQAYHWTVELKELMKTPVTP